MTESEDFETWILRKLRDWISATDLRQITRSQWRADLRETLSGLESRGLIESRKVILGNGYGQMQYRTVGAPILRQPMFPPVLNADWRDDAACIGTDADIFFPTSGHSTTRAAVLICSGCPVRQDCLAEALATDQKFGVWGGLNVNERGRLRAAILRGDAA